MVTSQTLERSQGLEKLNQAIDAIKSSIEASGGHYLLKMAVSVQNMSGCLF